MGGRTVSQSYGYSAISSRPETVNYAKDNLPVRYTMSSTRYIDYNYDSLNRLTGKTLSLASPLSYAYTYKASARGGSYTTTQIATETVDGNAYSYTYDSLGNITSIKLNGQAFRSYEYDSLNQLVRENNKTDNKTYEFVYDNYGNITAKKVYAYTTSATLGTAEKTISYAYGVDSDAGWNNILTEYNGEDITYDAIGNPVSYRGADLTWDGRELRKYKIGNDFVVEYTYDADGLRASKTVNGEKTTYQYIDGKLMYEDRNGEDLYYFYDSNGVISGIRYFDAEGNMTMIYVVTNALGDVIALYDKNGNAVVEYQYDAWGNIISVVNSTEGSILDWNEINPFRYRGYYYDAETELYYLQSRYYDAEVGRFINSDVVLDNRALSGINPFTYCGNNPVVRIDSSGTFLELLWDVVSFACSVKEVIEDPTDLGTWCGALLDGVDILVPCFGGFGEAYDIYRAVDKVDDAYDTYKAIDTADDVHDAVKAADNLDDTYDGVRTVSDFSGGACFIAGTSVFTENGYKNIEEIKPGDKVWATNPETGETELKKVVRTFVNETNELVYVCVNNEEIVTTPEHPFYVSNYGWIGAIDLRAGDRLVLINGEHTVVEKVQHEILENPIKVYNFEVEDFHTYYVGNTGVLVHNVCSAAKDVKLPTSGKIRYIPPVGSGNLPVRAQGGYLDKFGNIWLRGPSRTIGEPFEWDVQLSNRGKNMLGWLSKSGDHINISLKGEVTH